MATGGSLHWSPEQPSWTGTEERLALLLAGQPANLPPYCLPSWPRVGRPVSGSVNTRRAVPAAWSGLINALAQPAEDSLFTNGARALTPTGRRLGRMVWIERTATRTA